MPSVISADHLTRQVVIIHLSDLHFGEKHRFNPPKTPSGDRPARNGYPTALEKLAEDLNHDDPKCPVIFCLTGDFAEYGKTSEFGEAEVFIRGLCDAPAFGSKRGLGCMFFVEGNHDVDFAATDLRSKHAAYAQMMANLHKQHYDASAPQEWPIVHNRISDLGIVVATINSSIYVQKDSPEAQRGNVDVQQLGNLEKGLKEIPPDDLHGAIKIALIHHHPVLIPALAEPGRGYDAVLNSGKLLSILRRYGFHIILHGHKHDPYVFTEDARSAIRVTHQNPIMVAAGGSFGSTELPDRRDNCYNRISIKWHPAASQARILIETVGLTVIDEDGQEALPSNWAWKTLRREDLHFLKGECIPTRKPRAETLQPTPDQLSADDHRGKEYARLRGNLPCVEVRPSLRPDQGYEAIVWLCEHKGAQRPKSVTWSAGPKFPTIMRVKRDVDARFCATLDYWGPMLIQAEMTFDDDTVQHAFIYARIPDDCSDD
jgi:3',5'-cyclic AMP phosphodiesterase CpdA